VYKEMTKKTWADLILLVERKTKAFVCKTIRIFKMIELHASSRKCYIISWYLPSMNTSIEERINVVCFAQHNQDQIGWQLAISYLPASQAEV
jgi:hypothetical protein